MKATNTFMYLLSFALFPSEQALWLIVKSATNIIRIFFMSFRLYALS